MARQPLLPKYQGMTTGVGQYSLSSIPKLAAIVGECAAAWTQVDLHLALTLGSLLGVENAASVAVFTSLRNARAQREAMIAAAQQTLDEDDFDIFSALMNLHRSLDSERNDIVHGVWGKLDGKDDVAIWISLQNYATTLIRLYHGKTADGSNMTHEERVDTMLKHYFVYEIDDVKDVLDRINALAQAIARFHTHLRYRDKPAGRHALADVMSSDLVRREVERVKSSG